MSAYPGGKPFLYFDGYRWGSVFPRTLFSVSRGRDSDQEEFSLLELEPGLDGKRYVVRHLFRAEKTILEGTIQVRKERRTEIDQRAAQSLLNECARWLIQLGLNPRDGAQLECDNDLYERVVGRVSMETMGKQTVETEH